MRFWRSTAARRLATVAVALALAGLPAPPLLAQAGGGGPKTTNGTVSFKVNCAGGIIDQEIRATLTVEKPGKTSLVNGNPGAGQVDGNHNFPAGTTAGGVGAYYKGLLSNNGWTEGTDFKVDGGTITFFGISKLDAGTNHQHLVVDGSTDSKDVPYSPVTPADPPKKKVTMSRGSHGMAGAITLVGFGLHWSSDQPVSSSTSVVTARFEAQDSAAEVLVKLRDTLVAAGWEATLNGLGEVEIGHSQGGDLVYSLFHEIAYESDPDGVGNEDHWVFTLASSPTVSVLER
jgi:hypothetical protein